MENITSFLSTIKESQKIFYTEQLTLIEQEIEFAIDQIKKEQRVRMLINLFL